MLPSQCSTLLGYCMSTGFGKRIHFCLGSFRFSHVPIVRICLDVWSFAAVTMSVGATPWPKTAERLVYRKLPFWIHNLCVTKSLLHDLRAEGLVTDDQLAELDSKRLQGLHAQSPEDKHDQTINLHEKLLLIVLTMSDRDVDQFLVTLEKHQPMVVKKVLGGYTTAEVMTGQRGMRRSSTKSEGGSPTSSTSTTPRASIGSIGSGSELMEGEHAQFSILQRGFGKCRCCFEILSDLNQAVPNHLADESQTRWPDIPPDHLRSCFGKPICCFMKTWISFAHEMSCCARHWNSEWESVLDKRPAWRVNIFLQSNVKRPKTDQRACVSRPTVGKTGEGDQNHLQAFSYALLWFSRVQ